MNNHHSRSTIIFLSLTALFLFLHLFRLPFTPILFEGDHAVHMSNAWRMFLGESPFTDFFMVTFPGTEIYYLILFKLFGIQQWLLNATILLLVLSLTAVGLYFSRKILTGWAVYLPVLIFLVIGFRQMGIDGSHRFFGVLAVLIAVAIVFSQRTSLRLCLAGFICGIASSFTQPRGLIGIAAIVCFLLIEKFYVKQSYSDFVKAVICVSIPFALVIGFITIYFIAAAGFETFYFATFVFPVKHYPADTWNNFGAYLKDVPNFGSKPVFAYLKQSVPILFVYFLIPAVYLVFFIILRLKRHTIDRDKQLQLIFINLIGLFLALGVFSAPAAARLYQASIPGLISLVWILQIYLRKSKAFPAFLAVLSLLGISYTVQRQTVPVYALDTPSGALVTLAPEILSRYQWASVHTKPLDYLYEPQHPSLYALFQLKNPTPMSWIRANNFTTDEHIGNIIEGLKQNPPRYIIWNGLWSELDKSRSPDFHLQPLIDYLNANYHLTKKLDDLADNKDVTEYKIEIWEKNQ